MWWPIILLCFFILQRATVFSAENTNKVRSIECMHRNSFKLNKYIDIIYDYRDQLRHIICLAIKMWTFCLPQQRWATSPLQEILIIISNGFCKVATGCELICHTNQCILCTYFIELTNHSFR